jgi:hypothetical protein
MPEYSLETVMLGCNGQCLVLQLGKRRVHVADMQLPDTASDIYPSIKGEGGKGGGVKPET